MAIPLSDSGKSGGPTSDSKVGKKEGRLPLDGLQPNPNTKQTLNYGAEDAEALNVFKKYRSISAFTRL